MTLYMSVSSIEIGVKVEKVAIVVWDEAKLRKGLDPVAYIV